MFAAALLALPVLLLTGCTTTDITDGDNPYFGIKKHNERHVPRELQEDDKEYEDDY